MGSKDNNKDICKDNSKDSSKDNSKGNSKDKSKDNNKDNQNIGLKNHATHRSISSNRYITTARDTIRHGFRADQPSHNPIDRTGVNHSRRNERTKGQPERNFGSLRLYYP